MKKMVDFCFGVLYSLKEKFKKKSHKWTSIVRSQNQRRSWERRILRQGQLYRQELFNRLQDKINIFEADADKNGSKKDHLPKHAPVRVGQKISFYALNEDKELEGFVTYTNLEPTGEFFILQLVDGSQTFICRHSGDKYIGDVEF